jgi:hypothetical protein
VNTVENHSTSGFTALSVSERVALCREKADEAMAHAKRATPNFRAAYTVLAIEWLMLADEIARAAIGSL